MTADAATGHQGRPSATLSGDAQPPDAQTVLIADACDERAYLISDLLRTHACATDVVRIDLGEPITSTTLQPADLVICAASSNRCDRTFVLQNILAARPGVPTLFLAPADEPGIATDALTLGATDALVCSPGYLEQITLSVRKTLRHARRQSNVQTKIARLARTVEAIERDNAELKSLVGKFQSLAATDPLTALPNRRSLSSRLDEVHSLAQRLHADMSVMMIDLDGFKLVNDTLGHEIGDELLRAVAVVLRKVLRRSDIAARVGGDEFVVVMPHTSAPRAALVARRIQEQFSRFTAPLEQSMKTARESRGVVTVVRGGRAENDPGAGLNAGTAAAGMTVGIASLAAHPDAKPEELLALADRAMYQGKRSRRGSVSVCAQDADKSVPFANAA